jgi:hypothetical protein
MISNANFWDNLIDIDGIVEVKRKVFLAPQHVFFFALYTNIDQFNGS